MTVIWGVNYTAVKVAFDELPPFGFSALRLLVASTVFLGGIAVWDRPRLTRRDLLSLALVGLVGHCLYQMCFIGGLAHTSVANSSLIIGCTPMAVILLSAALGHERVTPLHWFGTAMSVAGIYLVVGRGASLSGTSLYGDLLTLAAIWCWAIYTVAARSLLARHSPLVVTGVSMAFGTVFFLPMGLVVLTEVTLSDVSLTTWSLVVFSALLALNLSYLIWYTAVQQIGNARTSIYSNMVPLVAMAGAVIWLDEPLDRYQVGGAIAVLTGVALAKLAGMRAPLSPEA